MPLENNQTKTFRNIDRCNGVLLRFPLSKLQERSKGDKYIQSCGT